MGARRGWGLFRWRNGADSVKEFEAESKGKRGSEPQPERFESGPLHPGMLESLAMESGAAAPEPEPEPGPGRNREPRPRDDRWESGPLHAGMLESLAMQSGAAAPEDSRDPGSRPLSLGPMRPGMLESLAMLSGGAAPGASDETPRSSLLSLEHAAPRAAPPTTQS